MMRLFYPDGSLASDTDPLHLTPERAGWSYSGFQVLSFGPNQERVFTTAGFESGLVPESGSYVVEVEGRRYELRGRTGVFDAVTDVVYVPLDAEVKITALGPGRLMVCTATATRRFDPAYIAAGDVAVEVRGAGQATRQINNFMSAATFDGADKLIAVEVLTPEGNWSSYPPHKHDELSENEVPLEEVYYFKINQARDGTGAGFGLHRTYTLDGEIDETVAVGDGDLFLVPKGYHGPCVAPPGYDMYYLNVMAGPEDERTWKMCNDPAHDWVWKHWEGTPQDPRLPMTHP